MNHPVTMLQSGNGFPLYVIEVLQVIVVMNIDYKSADG
jgi:hypothetical protein